MGRKRMGGRFVGKDLDGDGGAPVERAAKSKGPKAKNCRTFTRARVAEALPAIVETFVEEAKKGSIAHTKMLASLSGLDKGDPLVEKKRRRKSPVTLLMEKMIRETPK